MSTEEQDGRVEVLDRGAAQRIGGRDEQQDRMLIEEDGEFVAGVFDGHGGAEAAAYTRDRLWASIKQPELTAACFERGFAECHAEMARLCETTWPRNSRLNVKSTAGTTAVLCCSEKQHMWVAHCGDSRCVLGSYDGACTSLTRDHKPHHPEERLRIEKAGGVVYLTGQRSTSDSRVGLAPSQAPRPEHSVKLNMSRALGDFWSLSEVTGQPVISPVPEVQRLRLTKADDFLALFSDGISGVMSDKEAVAFLAKELSSTASTRKTRASSSSSSSSTTTNASPDSCAQRAAERLCDFALGRWAAKFSASLADNVSVVLLVLRRPPAAASPNSKRRRTTTPRSHEKNNNNNNNLKRSREEEEEAKTTPAPAASLDEEEAKTTPASAASLDEDAKTTPAPVATLDEEAKTTPASAAASLEEAAAAAAVPLEEAPSSSSSSSS